MEWKLSDEQEAYREALRDWLTAVAPSATVRTWQADGDVETFQRRFARDGMAGAGVAEDRGGQGGGVVELALTAEELARAAAPSAAWLATALAVPALPSELVEAALAGGSVALLAPAEELPTHAPTLTMDPDGRVSGVVPRVLNGDRATSLVAVVGAGEHRALRLVQVPGEGVQVVPRQLLDRSRSVADVHLRNAESTPLTADAAGYLTRATDLAGVLVAADSLGAMERMLDLAVDYSRQRVQFGVPIGSFQAVKHAAATILVGVEAGRSGVYFAAASVDAGDAQCGLHAAAVKAQVCAEGSRAADTALTMHGAIGYTWEHDLHLFYKRARLDEHLYGAPATWNERIADGLALM
jgi:alkylation response protein AidB-like acyl-CoA dehydrogenase